MNSLALTTLCLTSLATVGPPSAGLSAEQTMRQSIQSIRRNDIAGFLRVTFSAEELQGLERAWNEKRREKFTPDEDAQFREFMQTVTAPDAEQTLMTLVEPQLVEMRGAMPMIIGMYSGLISGALEQAEMSDEEAETARNTVTAFTQWAQDADFASSSKARKVVGHLCKAARDLKLSSMNDVVGMRFPQLLTKGDRVLKLTKDVFTVYGLDLNAVLDSVQIETVSTSGNKAVLQVRYELFGNSFEQETQMVKLDGRWVRREAVEKLEGLRAQILGG